LPISLLVDLYNILSLKNVMPAGGEDLDACKGDIALTFAAGNERFSTIGSEANEPPEPGEVVYKDAEGVLCRKFNWREAGRTCLTQATTNAVLVIEAIPPMERGELEASLESLRASVATYCGGSLQPMVLDQARSSCAL
jgi:DNA/RNA-binding domain of Phe-tRNA-synthetase-like protein